MAIDDWPRGEGPREKLHLHGPGVLSDAELLGADHEPEDLLSIHPLRP